MEPVPILGAKKKTKRKPPSVLEAREQSLWNEILRLGKSPRQCVPKLCLETWQAKRKMDPARVEEESSTADRGRYL